MRGGAHPVPKLPERRSDVPKLQREAEEATGLRLDLKAACELRAIVEGLVDIEALARVWRDRQRVERAERLAAELGDILRALPWLEHPKGLEKALRAFRERNGRLKADIRPRRCRHGRPPKYRVLLLAWSVARFWQKYGGGGRGVWYDKVRNEWRGGAFRLARLIADRVEPMVGPVSDETLGERLQKAARRANQAKSGTGRRVSPRFRDGVRRDTWSNGQRGVRPCPATHCCATVSFGSIRFSNRRAAAARGSIGRSSAAISLRRSASDTGPRSGPSKPSSPGSTRRSVARPGG